MLIYDAPRTIPDADVRARALRSLVDGLDLPRHRLAARDLQRLVLAVASRPSLYRDLVVDDTQHRWWMVLHRSENVDVRVLSWERDQESDWHDHGGSSGAFVVTEGAVVERARARDGVSIATRRFPTGELATFGPAHVHDVRHDAGTPAVSIHAYSPPLTGLTYYEHSSLGFVAREVVPEEQRAAFELSR